MRVELLGFFKAEAQRWSDEILSSLAKAEAGEIEKAKAAVENIDTDNWIDLTGTLFPMYAKAASSGAHAALLQVIASPSEDITNLANQNAIAYAKARGAELVGMRILDDGSVVPNPNPAWRIQDSTRAQIQADVVQAMEEGWSNDRLADVIKNSQAFSDYRAEMIARTETAFADQGGSMAGWEASGLVQYKRWLYANEGIGGDSKVCPVCHQNAGKTIKLGKAFPSGHQHAPAHPHCRCAVVAMIEPPEEEQQG